MSNSYLVSVQKLCTPYVAGRNVKNRTFVFTPETLDSRRLWKKLAIFKSFPESSIRYVSGGSRARVFGRELPTFEYSMDSTGQQFLNSLEKKLWASAVGQLIDNSLEAIEHDNPKGVQCYTQLQINLSCAKTG
ncbi:hypothetical protein [Endozoicomonas numazuensis]|uniref:hypothetical protein n=1 Tax=Endozoicomonas numazuensis TaxID=1137799 RepID=UPI001268F261|nr:hypothetical protein [Endozoicomonas numazuensis]